MTAWTIRPVLMPDDAAEYARLSGLLWRKPTSLNQILLAERQRNPNKPLIRLFAEAEGQIVALGRATCWGDPRESVVGRIYVDAAWRGRGIATELYHRITEFVEKISPKRFTVATFLDEPEGLRFIEKNGFARSHVLYEQYADLTHELAEPTYPDGYQFTDYASLEGADKSERVYACVNEADRDVPHIANFGLLSYDDFLRHTIQSDTFIPTAFTLALFEGEIVGVSNVVWEDLDDKSEVTTDFTGVLRSHRGKGLAKVLKHRSLKAAQSLGAKSCMTINSEENGPMLAINRVVGFKVKHQMAEFIKEIKP